MSFLYKFVRTLATFLWLNVIIILSLTCTNEYESNGISFWRSTSPFCPIVGETYSTLEIRNALFMQFKLIYKSASSAEFENVFRIGKNGQSRACVEHGSRYPSLYVDAQNLLFMFAISDIESCWEQYPEGNNARTSIEINATYDFIIHYNATNVSITYSKLSTNGSFEENGIIFVGERQDVTHADILYTTADVIFSDPRNNASDAILWDIEIYSYDMNDGFTHFPTYAPTIVLLYFFVYFCGCVHFVFFNLHEIPSSLSNFTTILCF